MTKRYLDAAKEFGIRNVVRVCSDNPLTSIFHIDQLIKHWHDQENAIDYLSYRNNAGQYSINTKQGIFAEMVSREALAKTLKMTEDLGFLEHVTKFVYDHPDQFTCVGLNFPKGMDEGRDIRLTVDFHEDFSRAQKVFSEYMTEDEKYNEDPIPRILSILEENIE